MNLTSIATQLQLQPQQVERTIQLLEEGNTIPFITRYRKEATGSLNEEQIREIHEKYQTLKTLEERRKTILETIRSQGKLTPQLEQNIQNATNLKTLEDLYLPYKPKKRTLATIAKEQGLEPLAQLFWEQLTPFEQLLQQIPKYLNPNKNLNTTQDALLGIQYILAEKIAETASIRQKLRPIFQKHAILSTQGKNPQEAETSTYKDYFQFQQPIQKLPPHRILAINRGEKEKALRVQLTLPEHLCLQTIQNTILKTQDPQLQLFLQKTIQDSFQRLLYPSLCREIRNELTQKSEKHAIEIFGKNLRKLLLTPPVPNRRILGIDPAYRTGCKLAIIDECGKLLHVDTIFPHPPQNQWQNAKQTLLQLLQKYNTTLIAIGNGTAHRETEELVSELLQEHNLPNVEYTIVNEAGASVYSTSKEAQEEFPHLDASYRGTISIARRLQDPLAEIVKIDPKSIGVGLYQHDLNQKELDKKVHTVVESCVNYVGVDLNTASIQLLQYVSGINRLQAKRIYEYRQKYGKFQNRQELLNVRGIGNDTFTQAAGFLKIPNSSNPLDNTQIHPESYEKTKQLLQKLNLPWQNFHQYQSQIPEKLSQLQLPQLAQELQIGLPTLQDIIENLKKPGRDPRLELPKPQFKKGILKLEDLKPNMKFTGVVRNVVDFGAFVDIGVKEDGLVHISELADQFVQNPFEIVSVGDTVNVWILSVDLKRNRISLSMRNPQSRQKRPPLPNQHKPNNTNLQGPLGKLLNQQKTKNLSPPNP